MGLKEESRGGGEYFLFERWTCGEFLGRRYAGQILSISTTVSLCK